MSWKYVKYYLLGYVIGMVAGDTDSLLYRTIPILFGSLVFILFCVNKED